MMQFIILSIELGEFYGECVYCHVHVHHFWMVRDMNVAAASQERWEEGCKRVG